ncbi:MAG: hypothetical protein MZU79_04400 [Anaerotruncus sp.]|nr:hypothetical protein [Anaerotruncus sp.]
MRRRTPKRSSGWISRSGTSFRPTRPRATASRRRNSGSGRTGTRDGDVREPAEPAQAQGHGRPRGRPVRLVHRHPGADRRLRRRDRGPPVDPRRSGARGPQPLGGTVAHGFLLLSLVPFFNLSERGLHGAFPDGRQLRPRPRALPDPVRAGSRVRNRTVLKKIEKRGFRKVLVTVENTMEVEGADKPAMVADVLALIYL